MVVSRGLGSTRSSPGLPIVMSRGSATNESTSKDSNIVSNEKSYLNSNLPMVNYEKVKVKAPKRNSDIVVPKIQRENPHIKNRVASTQEPILKPNNQC